MAVEAQYRAGQPRQTKFYNAWEIMGGFGEEAGDYIGPERKTATPKKFGRDYAIPLSSSSILPTIF
jgi:hypothetical protein